MKVRKKPVVEAASEYPFAVLCRKEARRARRDPRFAQAIQAIAKAAAARYKKEVTE